MFAGGQVVKEDTIELLKRIASVEDGIDPESFKGKAGWRNRDVRLPAGTVSRLYLEGYLDDGYESNSYHGYRLSQKARLLLSAEPPADTAQPDSAVTLTDDLFQDIVGHDETKELLLACLTAEKPVHVLLDGPPALAKSLFLWDIERAATGNVLWLLGSETSKSGLWDKIAESRPQVSADRRDGQDERRRHRRPAFHDGRRQIGPGKSGKGNVPDPRSSRGGSRQPGSPALPGAEVPLRNP